MVSGTATKDDRIYHVQRKIAVLAFLAGFFVALINFVDYLSKYSAFEALGKPAVFLNILLSALTLATGFGDFRFLRLLQTGIVFITAVISILDTYNSIHGLGLILLGFFLAFKYGFLKKHFLIKTIAIVLTVFALVMFSAGLDGAGSGVMHSLDSIIYLAVFLAVTYIIYQDEITEYVLRNREFEGQLKQLKRERTMLADMLNDLDGKIAKMAEKVDLKAMGLTKKELEVVEALILYRETEQQLAERLGISYHTLRNHFRHIRDKLGVDRREDIIEMCRNNFG